MCFTNANVLKDKDSLLFYKTTYKTQNYILSLNRTGKASMDLAWPKPGGAQEVPEKPEKNTQESRTLVRKFR